MNPVGNMQCTGEGVWGAAEPGADNRGAAGGRNGGGRRASRAPLDRDGSACRRLRHTGAANLCLLQSAST